MPKYTDTAISNEEKCISYDKIYNLDETEDANYLILVGININGDNEADIQTFLGAGTYLYSSEKICILQQMRLNMMKIIKLLILKQN